MQIVGVAPHPFLVGAEDLELTDVKELLQCVTLERALNTAWQTDAHLVCYRPWQAGEPSKQWPRLNKPFLGKVRSVGADIATELLVFDFDTKDKAPWSDPRAAENEELTRLRWFNEYPPTFFYRTRGGFRFGYQLSRPVPVDESEQIVRGMMIAMRERGLKPDISTLDWTRLFRLPFVMREKVPTWEEAYCRLDCNFEIDANPDHLPRSNETLREELPQTALVSMEPLGDKPDLRFTVEGIDPIWLAEAKRRLMNREAYAPIFQDLPLAAAGSRETTMTRIVGQVVTMMAPVMGSSAQLVFSLLCPAALRLPRDAGDPDWTDRLWDKVARFWPRERARYQAKEQAAQAKTRETSDRIVAGVRRWKQDLPTDEGLARLWVARHLIAVTKMSYYVMGVDGTYDRNPMGNNTLFLKMRELGLEGFVPLMLSGAKGSPRAMSAQELINNYGVTVTEVEGVAGSQPSHLRLEENRTVLVTPLYKRREDIEPEYNSAVDGWLRALCQDEADYQKLCTWIGFALAFEDGPICALSIVGSPGCGKKMLVQALSECIDTGKLADATEFGNHQYLLLQTPFLVINEGFPVNMYGTRDPADAFRHFVGGDQIVVNEKYQTSVIIRSPLRVILTANNMDVVASLAVRRDLSPDDRQALLQRLLHIDIKPGAPQWLRDCGGLGFTKGWIRGDDGSGSEAIVARHFLWLYRHRPGMMRGNRFLVEGRATEELVRIFTAKVGSGPEVVETLIRMIESPMAVPGMQMERGRVFVTTQAVIEAHRMGLARSTGSKLSRNAAQNALKNLTTHYRGQAEHRVGSNHLTYELDLQVLLREAIEHGYTSAKLRGLLDQQHGGFSENTIPPPPMTSTLNLDALLGRKS